jgi:predicted nucleic acid-binding protein
MKGLSLDTSVAVPYLVRSHVAHVAARQHVGSRPTRLTGHSLAETYSVLTRLPGDARLSPEDAVTLIEANFTTPALLDDETAASIPAVLAPLGVAGGAVYDALVALAARHAGLPLATRDQRAASTYLALQAQVEFVPT